MRENLSILFIEDNKQDYVLTKSYLSAKFDHFNLVLAKTADDAISELNKSDEKIFDIILLDLTLPDNEGEDLIEIVQNNAPKTPVIILTGYADLDFSIKSLSKGISDYLLKDEITPALLHKSILYSIKRHNYALQLKESRDSYSSLLNNIHETVYRSSVNDAFNIEYISSHVEQLTGYSPEHFTETTYSSIFDLIHSEDRENVRNKIKECIRKSTNWELEYRIVHKDGSERYVVDKGGVFHGLENNKFFCDGCILDVTASKKMAEKLRLEKESFRSSFENAAIGMVVTDSLGVIQKVNSSLCDILGFPKHDLIGEDAASFVHPSHLRRKLRKVSMLIRQEKEFFHAENKFVHKKGHSVWCILSVSVIRDENGAPLSYIGQVTDITDKKKIELDLEKLNTDLEQKVAERTKQLEFANKELEAFSYSVSHDLRSPLRAINGFSQILLEDYSDNLDKTGIHYLNRVRSASMKLSNLIDHFLSMAKVSRVKLEKKSTNLSHIAEEITDMLQNNDPSRNVSFRIEKNIEAQADPYLIKNALQNLIENAWKYTSKEDKAVIELGRFHSNGDIVYYVKDNGKGFDMSLYDNLFQPFKRLHNEKEYSGTGIGLATVHRIIKRHSGDIWADSEPDKGATFYFTL